jgi:hypothetical protein
MTPILAFIFLYAGLGAVSDEAAAVAEAARQLHAVRLSELVAIDGQLNEAVWTSAPAATAFKQRDPNEGAAPSERTEVRLAYDDDALYVAARMHDSQPKGIVARLGRRDAWLQADAFVVYLDGYHDRRSGLFFSVNAAGTLRDGTLYNDDWDDDTWDGVWDGRARIDDDGWTVEMRIPYSQLRFKNQPDLVFGINCRRFQARTKEDSYLAIRPKKENGFVSRFPELHGITGISPPGRISITPYATTRGTLTTHDPANPFSDGSEFAPALGADAKIGIGSGLTVDATVNPDFGQVEVDPAVVNLSDVETFFDEKRPFFVEGSNLFNFGYGGASNFIGFNFPNPDFFYSRRIGRAPEGGLQDYDYLSAPSGTTILGAPKVSGKVADHWNVATLHSFTQREFAEASAGGTVTRTEIEPAAYYGVARAQRELPDNCYGIGFVGTYARRSFADPRLRDDVNAASLTGGLDGWAFLGASKSWVLTGWTGASQVKGNAARLTALQEGPQHYFQRPDATHVELDENATALSGWAGRFALNKEKGNVQFNVAYGFITPGFDTNDLGFLWRADVKNGHLWGAYRWTEPGRFARSASVEAGVFRSTDFEGNRTWDGVFVFTGLQFLNYHRLQAFAAYNPDTLNPRLTRGGPLTLNPHGLEWDVSMRSDDRRSFWARAGAHGTDYAAQADWSRSVFVGCEWRPGSNISVSLEPRFDMTRTAAQYIDTFEDPLAVDTYGHRYVFARLEQETFSAGIRLNWTFSPRLSLQLYAQPLVASGAYADFGELARPRSYDFQRYVDISLSHGSYAADPDGAGPAPAVAFDNPDFNFHSLRGNAVLRWEFRPGSTAYFVWTQSRVDEEPTGGFQLGRSFGRLLAADADNIFLVKVAYRFGK